MHRGTRLRRAAWVALAAVLLPAAGHAADCPKPANYRIVVTPRPHFPQPVYDYGKDTRYLTKLANKGFAIGGLTVTSGYFYRFKPQTQTTRGRDGRHCVWVTGVEVQYGPRRVEVYVASNYIGHDCAFDHVLRHENDHVRRYRSVVASYRGVFEKRLRDATARMNPLPWDPKRTYAVMNQRLDAAVKGAYQEMANAFERENGLIDTEDMYEWGWNVCRGKK